MVTVQNMGWWLYLITQAEEKKCNNHICVRKDFNQLYYQDMPDMCLQNTPQEGVLLTSNTINNFYLYVLSCNYPAPRREKKHLYPWQYPFSASLPLISTSKHMHRDSLTPRHSLPAKMDFCQCAFVLQLIMCHHVYLSLRVSPRNAISGKWLAFCQHCAHSHPRISVFVGTFVDQLLVRTLTLTSNPLT